MKISIRFALACMLMLSCSVYAAENTAPDKKLTYKKTGEIELKLHVFNPEGHKASNRRPAIVFFFGGGWTGGSPSKFYQHCKYLASRGMVAMSAEYVSGMFGKRGLGAPGSASDPALFFDEFYDYNCQCLSHNYYPKHLWHNREKVELDGKTYSHDLIMNAAMDRTIRTSGIATALSGGSNVICMKAAFESRFLLAGLGTSSRAQLRIISLRSGTFPTLCEMAGVATPEDTDGISILPTLLGGTQRNFTEKMLFNQNPMLRSSSMT